MGKSLQINSAMERLIMFSFIIGFCEHIFACFWCIIGTEEAALLKNAWQNDGISNLGIHEQYIISLYFVTTTMTTVGYGDMSGKTGVEQVYLIIMMMSGGFIFSMLTGSLSSILQSMDQSNAALAEKMLYLNRLQNQYGVGGELYNEIKKTLNYDSKMAVAELSNFIEQLPPQLKVSVAITMYKETFDTHTFFIGMKNTQLLTIMG